MLSTTSTGTGCLCRLIRHAMHHATPFGIGVRFDAAFAAIAGISSASAADLAARPYTKAPIIVEPGYDWSGFYIGGNVGYSWGRERTDGTLTGTQNVSVFRTAGPNLISSVTTPLATQSLVGRADMNGVIGGGQIGYNWQSSKWLFGLEADFQGSDERATADICTVAGCPLGSSVLTANYKLDWFGTARGRVGFLATDRVLLYATGGLAYGHFAANAPLVPLSWGSTRAGWTVGALSAVTPPVARASDLHPMRANPGSRTPGAPRRAPP